MASVVATPDFPTGMGGDDGGVGLRIDDYKEDGDVVVRGYEVLITLTHPGLLSPRHPVTFRSLDHGVDHP